MDILKVQHGHTSFTWWHDAAARHDGDLHFSMAQAFLTAKRRVSDGDITMPKWMRACILGWLAGTLM